MNKVTTTREQPRKRQPKTSRCSECGFSVQRSAVTQRCPNHFNAPLVPWTTKLGVAEFVLVKMVRTPGIDIERWIESFDPYMAPGTTRGDMALALTYARKWGTIEEGSDLPSTATPAGLF